MKKLLLLLIIISIVTISIPPAKATIPGQGLTISPPIIEITLEPGQTYERVIKINNPTKEVVEVYPIARNFSAQGEGGTPIIETPNTEPTYGLASWIKFNLPKIALTSEQEVAFDYTITVPQDAEPGGHYASVLFASEPPKPDAKVSQVALASMIGSLILGKVNGDINEKAEVREFSTKKLFYLKPSVDFVLRVTNLGNIHIKPMGEIVISNWGRKVANFDINPKKGNILPNSIRRFDDLKYQGNQWSFGLFKAKLIATYGEKNQPLLGEITFLIIPWWLITAIALIIIIIIYIFWRKRKKRRKKPQISFDHILPPRPPQKKRIILQ